MHSSIILMWSIRCGHRVPRRTIPPLGGESVVVYGYGSPCIPFRWCPPLLNFVHGSHDGFVDFAADFLYFALAVKSSANSLIGLDELFEFSWELYRLMNMCNSLTSKFCWFSKATCLFRASTSFFNSYWSSIYFPLRCLKCSISPLNAATSSSRSLWVILRSFSRLQSSLPLKNSWSFIFVREF